jgi:hypothetical protein
MATTVSQPGYYNLQALTSLGALGAGMRLYTYTAGTTTKKNAYTEQTGTTVHTYTSDGAGGEYIALDARGELPFPLYLTSGAYDITLKTAAGATVWTRRADPSAAETAIYTPAGTGATTRTVQDKLRESVSVRDFGAVGDGVTDDTVAIQAAVDSLAAGSVLNFPNGTYRIDSTVTVSTSDITLDFGGAIIDATNITGPYTGNFPKAAFQINGALRTSTTLTASPAQYDTTITVADGTVVSAGDVVYISSSGELWYTEGPNAITRRFVTRVQNVSGNTVTLGIALPFSFDTASNTVTVQAYNTVKNIRVKGGSFYGGGYKEALGNGFGPGAFHVLYFDGVHIEGAYIEGFQNTAIRFFGGANGNVSRCTIRGYTDNYNDAIVEGTNSGFYGVYFNTMNQGSLSDCTMYRNRHAQDASNAWQIVVSNVRCFGGHRPALGSHGGASEFVYTGCVVRSSLGAIQWRGHHMTVVGCDFECSGSTVVGIYDSAGAAADISRNYVFSGNRVSSKRHAVSLYANIESATFSGGVYQNQETSGYAAIEIKSLDAKSITISGATVKTSNAQAIWMDGSTPRTRTAMLVTGCTIMGYTAQAVRVTGTVVTDPTTLVVKDNVLFPASGSAHVLGGTNMSNIAYGPNYLATTGLMYGAGLFRTSFSADYAVVAGDAGTMLYHPATDNNARVVTIPANAAVAFPVGTELTVVNDSLTSITIAITTDSMRLAGSASTGTRTLADNSMARLTKIDTTVWLIEGTGVT